MKVNYELEELLDTIISNYQMIGKVINANIELINGFKQYVKENKTN